MQKVEGVKDKMRPTRSVGRGLRLGEAWQAIFAQAAQKSIPGKKKNIKEE